ncbi:tail assembly chaperone [Candidatus Pantoea deserta]|uniref:Tail assembly chaperone n=1 Tax=Candidatus Pantoea deserta TaxID=1869313 RepID=A0A3N4PDZ1_9GAMM|nr:tail fiber assembly protein [Pantoea deserta]RPE03011.1 tail assembly chaperone [Pantoea deserta]
MKYSPTTLGFYPSDAESLQAYIDAGNLPDDLVDISDDDYKEWFNPPEGKYGAWVDGAPVLLNIPEPDYIGQAEAKKAQLLSDATSATYSLNLKLMMGRTLTEDETATVNAWLDYVDVLNDTDLSDAPDVQWPTKPA